MKIVCDTNIIISALVFPGGPPDKIIRAVLAGRFELLISSDILTEVMRVLTHKFHYPAGRARQVIEFLRQNSELVAPIERLHAIRSDPTDNRILECALEAEARFLITGDKKHLLPLKSYRGIKITSAAEFVFEQGI